MFTSLSWTAILPTGSRESWSARRTLLSLWPRRSRSTRLTRWTWYCSYGNRLTGNLVQNRVVARQVTWGGGTKKRIHLAGQPWLPVSHEFGKRASNQIVYVHKIYSLWISCSQTCRAMARTAAWDCISPFKNKQHGIQMRMYSTTVLSF